ncbi:MAG: hypothetical protein P0Y53_24775 [Candidatus Pseudobacter hemicellulosilyticus]|uniref:Lipocalin-like domain-containing protein n=1 Tax=Candidatus Pseudobacter hemicellulosilyticus TaxID=3121375 RepID=A0AAJ5WU73_9BACT|nr:MAG: hypothetical protein P0Y53_24775 [Pseudobacter sp.]
MKQLYSFILLLFVAVGSSSCSKDVLKPYEDRIEGAWELTNVKKIGRGSTNIAFDGGLFTFYGSGRMSWEDGYGGYYEGDWSIRRQNIPDCYVDENGNQQCDSRLVRNLRVNVVDFGNRDTRFEYFDEILFVSTNRFKAYIYDGNRTYIFEFRRR